MTPHEALDALARQTGIALAFNEQGLCRMRFDGRFVVDLEISDDETAIFLYSRLSSLPPGERGAELLTRMMRAHCLGRETGRAAFGLDGDDVLLFERLDVAAGPENLLYTELEAFMDAVAHWSGVLDGLEGGAP